MFSAGFSYAYNSRLFFLTYYPNATSTGAWLALVAIVGGALGVFGGGFISDRHYPCCTKTEANSPQRQRLWILGGSLLIAAPFALASLHLPPPEAFYALIIYYLFCKRNF